MTDAVVTIDRLAEETILIPIIGTSPLIVCKFSEEAKRQMLDGFQGRKKPKTAKDPTAEYERAFYRIHREGQPDAFGIPSLAFKGATVSAARFYGRSVKMTEVRQWLYVHGEMTKAEGQQLVEIIGEPRMREDAVTVGMTKDLRYRPEFWPWQATLKITYISSCLERSSLLALIDAGGMGVGVGQWRPERSGEFGTYRIDTDRPIERVER